MKLTSLALCLPLAALPLFACAADTGSEALEAGVKPAAEQAQQDFYSEASLAECFKAQNAYWQAKRAADERTKSAYYAEAIAAVAKATALEPENADYCLLASQIYRGKGGIPYAKKYFTQAESILKQRLAQKPKDIFANLDYAVLCYAGDVRFWQEYADYQKQAQQYARTVLLLTDNKELTGGELQARAMAYLLLGERGQCHRLLQEAAAKYGGAEALPAQRLRLYESTVLQGKWLWQVSEKYAASEFLLDYMTDPSRRY